MDQASECAVTYREPLSERILRFLLRPTRQAGVPDDLGLPAGFEDELRTEIGIRLGWRDRVAVLLTGRIYVRSCTATEHAMGKTLDRATGIQVAAPKVLFSNAPR